MTGEMNSIVASMPGFAAVAQGLNMQGLLGMDSTVSAAAPQITPPKSGASMATMRDERLQENLSRPKAVAQTASTRGFSPGAVPNMPGIMSPDVLMHPAVQQLLGQYGVTPEQLQGTVQSASPDLFITNPAAHANHPVLSGMVERALEGLAFTHGSRTVGEGLSNVAQGMLEAQQARAEKYNNQLMMPFAQASQVAQLQNIQTHQQFEDASARRYNSMADYNEMKQEGKDRENDLKDKLINMKMAMDPRFAYADKGQLAAVATKYGHLADAPDAELEPILAQGAAAKQAADTAAKISVKRASSGASGSGRAGAVDHTGDRLDFQSATADEKTAAQAAAAFEKEVAKGLPLGDDGQTPLSSREIQAKRQKLQQALSAAQQKKQDIVNRVRGLKVPGSGMTTKAPTTGTGNTYDPATKTWH